MNSTDTNAGGWPASAMRSYVNGTIYNALPAELRGAIIDTTVVSSLGSEDKNRAEGNFVSEDKLYLLSPEEVYVTSASYDTSLGTSRQLDWYRDKGVTTSSYSNAIKKNSSNTAGWWWLRSAHSITTTNFYTVDYDGRLSTNNAYITGGVSPAFRLG